MPSLTRTALAVPLAGLELLARFLSRRSLLTQLSIVAAVVALVVGGLLVGLPTRQIEAKAPTPYDPAAPTVRADWVADKLSVDAPFVLRFSKPMNQGSVADALVIAPATSVRLVWDSAAETLSITPATYWEPFTSYSITLAGSAMDQSGMAVGEPAVASFATGELTSGKITASVMASGLVAPSSAFVLTFTRPVKLATVQARLSISPPTTGTITGDDPDDQTSQVFTFTPADGLDGGTNYTVSFDATNATDADGLALLPVEPLKATTMQAPAVVRFRPEDGKTTADPNQVISVRFTAPMDRASTAAAFGVYVNNKRIRGTISWSENDTVLAIAPSTSFKVGAVVTMRVASTARSKAGMKIGKTITGTFRVVKVTVRRIVQPKWNDGVASKTAPWHSAELYMLQLVNCTRTGGWVTSGGSCSSVTHHVLPAQNALSYNIGIANNVARPYAKYMADRNALSHYLVGTPKSRLASAGYSGRAWGENITSPSSSGSAGMIASELFFQNEYRCASGRCEFGHYLNVMNGAFRSVGIGVWVTRGHVRVVLDFWG
jgi:hypothetical protein